MVTALIDCICNMICYKDGNDFFFNISHKQYVLLDIQLKINTIKMLN